MILGFNPSLRVWGRVSPIQKDHELNRPPVSVSQGSKFPTLSGYGRRLRTMDLRLLTW